MAEKIIMPKAGMAMEEGKILKWLVSEGDKIQTGDIIMEIETDKVAMEVEAMSSGTLLKILAHEGDTVPVTQTIGYIGKPGERIEWGSAKQEAQKKQIEKTGDYDVIVVGGGPAGYVAAIRAAQLGGKVALVEKDVVGGTCLNRGCIPAKTYLKSAEILHQILSSEYRGIHVDVKALRFDMKEAMANKNEVVRKLTGGVASLLKSNGVKTIKGTGIITDAGSVMVGDDTYTAKSIIYAGGSIPSTVNIPGTGSKLVLNSDDMLDLDEVPKRLAVIGGGVIGLELGQAFSQFGSKVTVIEMMDSIVPNMDSEVSALLRKQLEKAGIEILTSTGVEEIEEVKGGLKLKLSSGKTVEADKALMSVGRKPDISGIERLGIETERGRVKVDEYMRTSVAGVYAPGDVNGKCMLAHAAFKMGEIAAENAMGGSERYGADKIPSCIYTMPEVGAIGLTEAEAKEKQEVKIGRFPFAANGRSLASGEGAGFVKVISDKKYGEVLGIHIIGPNAAEMINEASLMMKMEVTDDEMTKVIHGHPTYSESLMEAAADAAGHCIHLPKK